ncbi:hypothetical protein GQ53DRAFT_747585 [Thozetella sp. PMI_491]|nr:hypothetical protein GQ53DRAFT_747585 [Thozetella sp. PMI_491]
MEDPWGSPWTTADPKPPSPVKTASSIGLEPPPRAFLSTSSSPRLPAISGSSPWADDNDGFGDWAAPDSGTASWSNGWGGSEGEKSPRLTPTPKDEGFGKPSPIAWPGSIALPKPASGSSFRQPSPSLDPWSSEFSLSVPLGDDVLTPRLPPDVSGKSPEKPMEDAAPEEHAELDSAWSEDLTIKRQPKARTQDVDAVATTQADRNEDREEAEVKEDKYNPSQKATIEIRTEEHGSTRSSSSNDESDPRIETQDSPITSIDEDSRARLQTQRTASGKVQELVEKFDGIARQASEELTIPTKAERGRSRGRSPLPGTRGTDSDDGADFGDFEEAEEEEDAEDDDEEEDAEDDEEDDEDELPRASTRSPSTSPARTPPPKSRQATSPAELSSPAQSSTATPSRIRELMSKFGDIKFDVPMGDIDKLFEKKGLEFEPGDGAEADVSDRIITDSFTEIAERKTWYRISRHGSSRKHNVGDDDNYRLVAWPTSTLHLETIKIVRRWMEEDSFTGRPTLGGTVSKSNMFGWDSAAEPVSLDKVFGRKSKPHSRAASLHQPPRKTSVGTGPQEPPPKPRKASGTPKSPPQWPLSMGIAPAPTFGWSTGAIEEKPLAQAVSANPPTITETSSKSASNTAAEEALKPPPRKFTPPSLPAPPAKAVPPPVDTNKQLPTTSSIEDEDDDWGEMVSSPQMDVSMSQDSRNGAMPSLAFKQQAVPPKTTFLDGQSSRDSVLTPPNDSHESDLWSSVDFSVFDKPSQPSTTMAPKPTISAGPPPAPVERDNFTPVATPTFPKEPVPAPIKRKVTFDEILSTSNEDHFTPTTPIAIISPIPLSGTTPTSPYPPPGSADDITVKRLIRTLPDLSYMLR